MVALFVRSRIIPRTTDLEDVAEDEYMSERIAYLCWSDETVSRRREVQYRLHRKFYSNVSEELKINPPEETCFHSYGWKHLGLTTGVNAMRYKLISEGFVEVPVDHVFGYCFESSGFKI